MKKYDRKHITLDIHFTYVGKIRIPLYFQEQPLQTAKPA
ncbi:hypothetical protein [Candidatus Enterococcus ferrettii]